MMTGHGADAEGRRTRNSLRSPPMRNAQAEAPVFDHVASDAAPTQSPAPDRADLDPLSPRPLAGAARAAASRENGRKSRGPKTPQGKQRSKFNRLQHGLCAATTVLPGEDPAAFAD